MQEEEVEARVVTIWMCRGGVVVVILLGVAARRVNITDREGMATVSPLEREWQRAVGKVLGMDQVVRTKELKF